MHIHPQAFVSPSAKIGSNVRIGPFSVVERDVTIGTNCILESHVVVKSGTTLGHENHLFEGAVLGGLPQHTHMSDSPGELVIGSGNTIRENVTIHRAMNAGSATMVGDGNLLMVNAHIAHDCVIGDHIILTNNVMMAGHVVIEDRAYMSGASGIHQFCRVGSLAMIGGQAHLVKDVPPFVTVDGLSSSVVGLNSVGLRRAGFQLDEIRQLKAAYRVIYRSGLAWAEILDRLKVEFSDGPVARFYEFLAATKRGIVAERRLPPGAAIKLHKGKDDAAPDRRKPDRRKTG